MNADERQDDSGDQQDVQRVHPGEQDAHRVALVTHATAGEVTAEQRPVQPGSDDRHAHRDRRQRRPQADAGQQVVGQRVTEVALEHRQDQQQRADDPVGLTRPAEGAGEEDARQVHHDRRREQQRRPVVDLPDEQSTAHLEADVEGRGVRLGHLDAPKRLVDTLIRHFSHRRVEEQRQVHAGEQQHDEAVHRDLAQQERPVRGEYLVQLTPDRSRRVVAGVDGLALLGKGIVEFRTHDVRSQNAGPTGSAKSPLATRYPSSSMVIGNCAKARAAGPKIGRAKCSASNCDWWHGHRIR